ncbi:MAG: TolC family protein [Planctomycetota bacterium]
MASSIRHRSKHLRSRRKTAWSRLIATIVGTVGVTVTAGCGLLRHLPEAKHETKASYSDGHGLQIEYPDVQECATPVTAAAESTVRPLSLNDPAELPTIEMSLEEAINLAVSQSPVLRSIGGTIVTAPVATPTVYDPGLTAASPVQGTEAALAAFDAQYTSSLFFNKVDTPANFALGAVQPTGQAANFNGELSKTTATGASFALRHIVNYDRSNLGGVFRDIPSAFDGWLEAEWRQPLLQGAGVTYNRIAGPTNIPGQYNGVLIARLNEDTWLADFEAAVINLVSDVEQAYWDLVTAYRVLDTQIKGRQAALQTFQYQQVRLEVGSGRSDEEAQARSQYYQFQAQVESALGGPEGLYQSEQRLRYLIGYPATDGRLIRPSTDPTDAKVVFDWDSALGQALERRVEVRRQRMAVQRRELELTAAQLNLRPRLDLVMSYRWNGLGDNLIGNSTRNFSNFYGTILGGDFQEGRAGLELNFPVGFRAAANAVAHARLGVQRERAVLSETELRVSHDLSDAARQVEIAYRLVETNFNRVAADLRQVEVLQRRYRDGSDNINFLLQAQRQAVTSTTEFYRTLSAYNLALRDFHREKGSLLAYNSVQMAEGPWAPGALRDAYEVGRFLHPRPFPHKARGPKPLTSGLFDPSAEQSTAPPFMTPPAEGLEGEQATPMLPSEDPMTDQPPATPPTVDVPGGGDMPVLPSPEPPPAGDAVNLDIDESMMGGGLSRNY